ncbi:MAG TPA: hypothetical protein VEZ11_06645 [Thermoanaerobaculia bacterium]|nr:hypothetical protein [Thermoanaerobaculia bacterium]
MGLMEKQVTPPRKQAQSAQTTPATQTSRSTTPAVRNEVVAGLEQGVRDTVRDSVLDKYPYLKFAFANPYNLSLLIGGLATAGITLNPLLAMIVLGLEGIWLLHAPESKRLQHILWDPKFKRLKDALDQQKRLERTRDLASDQRERVELLVSRQKEIQRLAGQNPSFSGELLRAELIKTDRLVDAFIDMAVTVARYEHYLGSVDDNFLKRESQRWESALKTAKPGDAQTDIAQKNLAVIKKRIEKVQQIRDFLDVARGQLDLIENSFQLIGDQIVTMQSPQELSGQLDELLDGVESIRQTAADTETLLGNLGIK